MKETVNPDTTTYVVKARCGEPRQDGGRCRHVWFSVYVNLLTRETFIALENAGWGRKGRWEGAKYEAEPSFTEDGVLRFGGTRWNVECSRCRGHHTLKKSTLEQTANAAAVKECSSIWLADLTRR